MTLDPIVARALAAVAAGSSAHSLETQHLDFKTVGRSTEDSLLDLAEACACFANADGGTIVVGVRDRPGGQGAFEGSTLDPRRTQRRIYEVTDPSLIVTVDSVSVEGIDLTIITVPRSPDVHQVRGKATERIDTACQPMTSMRIAAVIADRRADDWSAKDSGVSPSMISARAEEDARRRLLEAPDAERQSWAGLPVTDLASRLGLVTSRGTLNNAGALLLVGRHGPLVDYTHRKTRSGELTANERVEGPGLTVILRVLELVDLRTERTPILLVTGQQLFLADLPDVAVREAVVNAFMHRDYQASGTVQVEHADTRLAVTSPGDFVVGVTPANVLTVSSRTRNPVLANTIRALTLAEAAGVGVDRMYAAMTEIGHRPPVFETDGTRVTVSLHGGAPNTWVTRYVTTLPSERRRDPDTLLVLTALLSSRTVTAASLAPVLQKDVDEVETILRRLTVPDIALVEQTRNTLSRRHGAFRLRGEVIAALGPAVAYRHRAGDDTDRKIIEVARETGQVTGRLVRSILDVHPSTASKMLADLVEREILVKTSDAQRGPSVTYGPGPKFPHTRPGRRSRRRAMKDAE